MSVRIFSTTSVWNISYSNKNWMRFDQKYKLVFMESTGYSYPIVTKFENFSTKFENIPEKFYENLSSGSRCRRTDIQGLDEASSRFSQFYERP